MIFIQLIFLYKTICEILLEIFCIVFMYYYLRQRGYAFISIGLGIFFFAQKLLNRFSQNSMEKWHIGTWVGGLV